jgi:acetylornithine deacetylase/succinyl-diaminopimelate desuccinylase-like protein
LIRQHLDKQGCTDLSIRQIAGGDEWSQTSVEAAAVQSVLAIYQRAGIEPQVWPRTAGSSPEWEYTRKIGMPAVGGGLGHGGRAHADDEYIVIDGTDRVGGIVQAEQSIVDILYVYAAWPEKRRASEL